MKKRTYQYSKSINNLYKSSKLIFFVRSMQSSNNRMIENINFTFSIWALDFFIDDTKQTNIQINFFISLFVALII